MATYTKEEFIRQVLLELTVLDAAEAPEAEDFELVSTRMQQKFEELYEEGLIPFDIDGPIPSRYFLPLMSILAFELMTSYGQSSKAQELTFKADSGTKQLWKLRQGAYIATPTEANYF